MAPPVTFKGDATKLSVKQRAFVEAYLKNGENGAEAYRVAYNSKASPLDCARHGDRMLKHHGIGAIVAEARRKASDHLQTVAENMKVTKERISLELAKIAFGQGKYAQTARVTDQRQALMDLGKLHGYVIDRSNVRLVRSVTDLTDEELAALAAEGNKGDG